MLVDQQQAFDLPGLSRATGDPGSTPLAVSSAWPDGIGCNVIPSEPGMLPIRVNPRLCTGKLRIPQI